jgi:uncharacterized protein
VMVNNKAFNVEVAKSQIDKERGLSGRNSLLQDNGMLFVFDKPGYYPFLMRNMEFALDIIFIDNDEIVAVYPNVPPMQPNESGPLYGGGVKADRVLEINAGLAEKYSFNEGDSVKIDI